MCIPMIVAIAEDNSFSLKVVLDKLAGIDTVQIKHITHHGAELLEKLSMDPVVDLVLMDIEMPVMNGIETTSQVRKKYPQIRVVMLTTFDDDEKIFQAILAGASGYLLKDEEAGNIQQAFRDVENGGAPMSPAIALKVLNLVRQPLASNVPAVDFELTAREIELLEQLKSGLTYDQIAANLFISNGTVRKHIENIYRKLQVNNKVDAVQKAMRHRIV